MKIVRILCIVSALFYSAALSQSLHAEQEAKPRVDLGAFIKEIMRLNVDGSLTELIMWVPYEFYVEAAIAEGGKQTREATEEYLAFLKPYLPMIVQCSIEQPDGRVLYSNEEDVRARAALHLEDGTEIRPMDDVPPLVAATVAAMKVILASEGDPGGANMHLLIFPNKDDKGQPIVDTTKKDKLSLVLKADVPFGKSVYTWHTPFDATMNIPPCKKCGEEVSAKWSFCPWCGEKLPK